MKLVWRGRYKGVEDLPIVELPPNAIKYKEPKSVLMLNFVAGLLTIPVLIIVFIITVAKCPSGSEMPDMFNMWGAILAIMTILPHEILHGVLFPKESEVGLWVSPKSLMAFVHCVEPVSKWRFIAISILPNLVFGYIPFMIWMLLPYNESTLNNVLYSFACWSILIGVGDYLNIINTLVQVPKGAVTQISGFHSYWYKLDEEITN